MRLREIAAVTAAACILAVGVCADEANLLEDYGSVLWQGDSLAFDNASGAIYFDGNDSSPKAAVLEIEAEGTGIYFSIDGGNGVNTNDSGYCTLEFLDESGEVLSSFSTGNISGLQNFSRFYIGSEDMYCPLPEGTERLVISLHAAPKEESGKINVYFRNLMLYMSSEKPLEAAEDTVYMSSIPGLTKVEVGLEPYVRWIWIGIIFAVAMVFYFVRVKRDKYKTAEVIKAGKRKL